MICGVCLAVAVVAAAVFGGGDEHDDLHDFAVAVVGDVVAVIVAVIGQYWVREGLGGNHLLLQMIYRKMMEE